jgi:hypothetical protein
MYVGIMVKGAKNGICGMPKCKNPICIIRDKMPLCDKCDTKALLKLETEWRKAHKKELEAYRSRLQPTP